METVPALILLFSICAVSIALLIIVINLVKIKTNSPAAGRFSGDGVTVNSAELRIVLDSITDYICIIDDHFKIRYANKSYRDLTGRGDHGDGGNACHELLWKRASPCDDCPARETLLRNVPVLRKKVVLRIDPDHKKHLEISSYPIVDENNRVVRVIEYIRDMTQESHMLEELIRSEKLAGIGVMTAGIAHEMNNALSGISGTASNLLTMPKNTGSTKKG